jgi:hypothetical protein
MRPSAVALSVCLLLAGLRPVTAADPAEPLFQKAAENGVRSEEVFRRARKRN